MELKNIKPGSIRVFISSTFNDMQAERDHLVKKVFPVLRSKCEKAGISFTEVDLRWGITNEEAAEGKVLSICLEEIEQCRPYFIGILGDRYGWVPDSFPPDLSESEPWLEDEVGKSVTELEILNGVFNNPDMSGHAFFYFRQEGTDAVKQPDADKLVRLKQRIRKSGFPLKEGFSSPEELGTWVEADLKNVIDPQLIELEKMNDIVLAELQVKAHIQIQSAFFEEPTALFESLDLFNNNRESENSILLYEGESGIGKYTNLSNWYLQRKDQSNNQKLIYYPTRAGGSISKQAGEGFSKQDGEGFLEQVGEGFLEQAGKGFLKQAGEGFSKQDGEGFSEVNFMLRYLIHQLQGQSPEFISPPEDARRFKLLEILRTAMKKTTEEQPCTIIIPAIDQLSDAQSVRELILWLPYQFPEGIKLIVSASDPQIIRTFDYWKIERIQAAKLSANEIKEFTQRFLVQYRKKLSPALIDAIAESTLTALPVNLFIILEELRILGNHKKLEETLFDYLTAADAKALYLKVITRWETDFNGEYPDLVKKALTCIFMAMAGLSEAELRGIIGGDSLLPPAYWSPFYVAFSKWTQQVKGNLKISNKAFIEAIIEKYLNDKENVILAHQLTADYFLNKSKQEKAGARVFTELPYALFYRNDYNGFVDFYANRETLKRAWSFSPSLVTKYFHLPEKHELGNFSEIFSKEIGTSEDYTRLLKEDADYLITAADILETMGENKWATMFWNMIAGIGQQDNNDGLLEIGVSHLAFQEMQSGNTDKAMGMYEHLLQHYEQKDAEEGIVSTYHSIGLCLQSKEEYEEALQYFEKAALYFEEKKDMPKLLSALINCSNTLERIERFKNAEKLLGRAEAICKQLGDIVTLAIIYDEKASLLRNREEYDQALDLHNQAVEIFDLLNHADKFVTSLALRGKTHFEMLNISGGVEDYISSIYNCIKNGFRQTKNEVIRMLDESMKWNVLIWLGIGHKELLDELFYELENFSTKDGGIFEEAADEFYGVMEIAVAFANNVIKEGNSKEE